MNNDLISRQAALDACHDWDYGEEAYPYGDTIEERLRKLPPAQLWIPVSERLPELAGTYLVTNSLIGYDELEITYFEDGRWDTAGMPIAWMFLPLPYKEAE